MATQPVPPVPNVSPLEYFGPLVNADWTGRWFSFHRGWFRVTRLFVLAYFAALIVGAVVNVWFPDSLRHLNWIAAMAFLLTAVAFILTPLNIFGPAGVAFVAAQPGGEVGLSVTDGKKWAETWIYALGRFAAMVALYGSLPFFVLALWPIGSNPVGAIVMLAASVFLTVWCMYTNRSGKFVLNFSATILIAVIVWTLGSWTPGIREYQKDLVAWTQHKLGLKSIDDRSTDAKRRAEAATAAARVQAEMAAETAKQGERNACYAKLEAKAKGDPAKKIAPVIPTAAEFEECAKIGADATTVTTAPSTASTSMGQATAPAPATPVAMASVCSPYLEVDYVPSESTNGRLTLDAPLPPGKYKFQVSGTVQQHFLKKTDMSLDYSCDMDALGRINTCYNKGQAFTGYGGGYWRPQPVPGAPLPSEVIARETQPYGRFFVLAKEWGYKPLFIGEQGRIETSQPLTITLGRNIYAAPDLHRQGPGSLQVMIEQCT